MSKCMNIAIALNNKVIVPAYVMIRSLVMNNMANPIRLYVLHSELTTESCKLLQDAACYKVNNLCSNEPPVR